jgi:sugar transferase (PEP-CTERM/EpsH1 system associated)
LQIAWVSTRLPFPLDSGGQIRTYHILRELNRRHDVFLVTLADPKNLKMAQPALRQICKDVIAVAPPKRKTGLPLYIDAARHFCDAVPFVISKHHSRELTDRLTDLMNCHPVDLLVCDYLTPALHLPQNGKVPRMIFEHNVEAMIWERLALEEKNPLKRFYLGSQARKMSRFEKLTLKQFDACVAVSEKDKDHFRGQFGVEPVYSIPTGVDTEYFSPTSNNGAKGSEIIFVGSMDWMPNQDGILFFVRHVLPLIRKQVPTATLTIVGRRPARSILRLAQQNPGVVVTGTVEDVRPYLRRARLCVVPLRIGGGTRIKIFEAMASAVPVVSTTIGAEGLPVRDGTDLLIADQPQEFAAACVRLLKDPELHGHLSGRGRKLVKENFSWRKVGQEFERICLEVAAKGEA